MHVTAVLTLRLLLKLMQRLLQQQQQLLLLLLLLAAAAGVSSGMRQLHLMMQEAARSAHQLLTGDP
jgi:hypothetical protein